jgi:hypothetical protein
MNILQSCALVWLFLWVSQLVGAPNNSWIATWASSPQARGPDPHEPLLKIENQTVRERVRISIGGSEIRPRFSNEFRSSPLLIGSATVAIPTDASVLLNLRAWQLREPLRLNATERSITLHEITWWSILVSVGIVSLVLVLPRGQIEWSGWIYFSMAILVPLHRAYFRRKMEQTWPC